MLLETRVDLDEAAGRPVSDGHRVGRMHEGLGELFLTGAQGVFCALAFAGIEEGAEHQALALQLDVLARQYAIENIATTGAQLYFLNHRLAAQRRLLAQLIALAGVNPEIQLMDGAAKNVAGVPAEGVGEVLVDLDNLAVVVAHQHHDVGAQAEQAGEAFLGGAQSLGTLLLGADVADHAEHARPTIGLALQAAGNLQPVQAAVRPANTVAQGVANLFALEDGVEFRQNFGALLFGDQLDVVQFSRDRAIGVEAEQGLGAARPVHLTTANVPIPGAEMGAVQRGQQTRRVLPGLLEFGGIHRRYVWQGRGLVSRSGHGRTFLRSARCAGRALEACHVDMFLSLCRHVSLSSDAYARSSRWLSSRSMNARAAFDRVRSVCRM